MFPRREKKISSSSCFLEKYVPSRNERRLYNRNNGDILQYHCVTFARCKSN